MPRIINAYANGNSSIADSLSSLGDSMFDNQAQKELARQNALAKIRENQNIPLLADAVAGGRTQDATRYGIMANEPVAQTAGYNQFNQVSQNGPDSTAGTTATMAVPGANYNGTVAGTREGEANKLTMQQMASDRAAAAQEAIAGRQVQQQQWTDEHTLVNLRGPDGRVTMVPKSQVSGLQAHGYDVVPTLDQVKANAVSQALQPTPEAAPASAPMAPPAQPTAAPAAPSPVPAAQPGAPAPQTNSGFPGLVPNHPPAPNPLVQEALGLPPGGATYLNPTTGQVGMSYNGGRTVQDSKDGQWYRGAGNGFLPTSGEAAAAQVQGNNQRAAVANPPPPATVDPNNNAAMADARSSTGIGPFLLHHANDELGATGVIPAVMKAWGLGEEIGPGQERARQGEDIRNNEARTALLMSPGRQSTQQQKWVEEQLPEGNAMGNAATEANKIPKIVAALQGDLNDARTVVGDINTPTAQRTAAVAQIAKLQHAIRLFTQPAQNAPQGAAPASAPQGAPVTATNPKTGQKVQLVNGQWVPMQ